MIIVIESVILCALFTLMVYLISRDPIKTLYNYPPKIQERVKSLDEYKDKIPAQENKVVAKLCASLIFLDMIWFCHDKHFILKGTEDMIKEYHNYWFHIKGFFIGELLALVICGLAGIIIQFVL